MPGRLLVVIGGGLAPAAELLLPDLRRRLGEMCLVAPRVAASAMGDESVALGAARLALDDADRSLFAA